VGDTLNITDFRIVGDGVINDVSKATLAFETFIHVWLALVGQDTDLGRAIVAKSAPLLLAVRMQCENGIVDLPFRSLVHFWDSGFMIAFWAWFMPKCRRRWW